MPHSSTANRACDVVKDGGNDTSFAGPFATIAAAINYLKTNFTLDTNNHGVIYIGPGVFEEQISLTSIDYTRFIDFVGAGKDLTTITSSSSPVIDVGSGNENGFYNLNVFYDNSDDAGYCINIVAGGGGSAIIQNCKIYSRRSCFNTVGVKTQILDCEIFSISTHSDNIIEEFAGLMSHSVAEAILLANEGYLINTVTGNGIIQYCLLRAWSASTKYDSRGIGTCEGYLFHCTINAQGYALVHAHDCKIEYCHFSTEGGESTPTTACVDTFDGVYIINSYFQQNANANLKVVNRGSINDDPVRVYDSTFCAHNNATADIVGSIEVDNSHWENCRMISSNDATSGYSLASDDEKRIVTIKNIVSNRTIDPQLILIDNGLESKTIGEAKGYNQRRWVAINCYYGYVNCFGVFTYTAGTPSNANEQAGHGTKFITGSNSGDYAGLSSGDSAQTSENYHVFRKRHNPTFYIKFRLGYSSDVHVWCGLVAGNPANNTNIGTTAAAIRFFTGTDTNFQYVTHDGTNQIAPVDSGVTGDTNVHTLKITLDEQLGIAVYEMDNDPSTASILSSNVPGSDTELGFIMRVFTADDAERDVFIYDIWCEYNA